MSEDSIKKNISINIGKYRELSGMTQKELASKLNISPSRVSNWEQGANCPTIDILFKVCEVLNVSINDIYGVYSDAKIRLSYDEIEHIRRYQNLDDFGKETVNITLSREAERVSALNRQKDRIEELESAKTPIIELQPHLEVNAAHARTDIDIPKDADTSEDDMMDENNF